MPDTDKRYSIDDIENKGADRTFGGFPMREIVGYDGTNLQRVKVNSQGELIVATSGGEQTIMLDDATTTNVTYIGVAPMGTATSAASWQIKKIDESASPITLKVLWADGNDSYDNVYDNRASLSYS